MRAHLASLLLSRAWLPAPHAPARAAVRASVGSADAPLAVDVAVIGGGPAGYAIASLTILAGVVTLALPITIIGANFDEEARRDM